MPAKADAGNGSKTGEGPAEQGLHVVALLLAAIGGGIGVLGFVAFFGAGILWARLDEAGLPGNDAVAVIPKSVLIATGASFLAPALLAAFGFTALLYLVETITLQGRKGAKRKLARNAEQLDAGAKQKRAEAQQIREEIDRLHQRSLEATRAFEAAQREGGASEAVHQTASKTYAEWQDIEKSRPRATAADQKAAAMVDEANQKRAKHGLAIEEFRVYLRIVLVLLVFFIGFAVTLMVASVDLAPERIGVLVLLLLALTVVCLGVLVGTDNFAWFVLAAFVAAGVMAGFITYYRTVDHPKVEPVALLRTGRGPLYGFFVAQSSDRIYLGVKQTDGIAQLNAVPRDEVTDLAIGNLQKPERARKKARQLALDLCLRANRRFKPEAIAASAKSSPSRGQTPPCDAREMRVLDGLPAVPRNRQRN